MKLPILNLLTPKRITGNRGERAAARYLFLHGYRILERNYVANGHEIDLICARGNTLVFAEVKTRTLEKLSPKEPRPASAVTPEKQRSIISAANYYVKSSNTAKRMRFDIVEVYLTEKGRGKPKIKEIHHLPSAFNRDTAHSYVRR